METSQSDSALNTGSTIITGMTMNMIKRTAVALVLATSLGAVATAPAVYAQGVPVHDAKVDKTTKEQLEQTKKILEENKLIKAATEAIQKATGSEGKDGGSGGLGGLSSLLKGTGLDKLISGAQSLMSGGGGGGLSGAMGMLQGVSQIMQTAKSLKSAGKNPSQAMSSALELFNKVSGGSSEVGSMQKQLQSILYSNQSGSPTSQQVESINDMRRLNLQNAITSGLAIAMQVKNALGGGGEANAIKSLAEGAQNSQNLRGDIAANTSALLKIIEQTTATNGLLASILHIDSAYMIANDGVNGREVGGN